MTDGCLVLVPLRSFTDPKTRLADVLTTDERIALATLLASSVLDALDGRRVAVVSDDPEVAAWSRGRAVEVFDPTQSDPTLRGLNPSVTAGRAFAAATGATQVAVVHADLAEPATLGRRLDDATAPASRRTVSAVPDTDRDGTNVLVIPTDPAFRLAYGRGSFARHRAEALRLGWPFVAVVDEALGWDVDTPDDLRRYRAGRRTA